MAQKKMNKLPAVLRDPLKMQIITDWMRDQLEEYEKRMAAEGRAQRTKPTVQLIKAGIAEIERNAAAKIGDHLDNV